MSPSDRDAATARLLWASCRPDVDVDAITMSLDGGADVGLAVGTALDHRVGPLLHRGLGAAAAVDRPGPTLDLLRKDADLRRVQAELLLPLAVSKAIEPLTAAGLEPLLFKGPTLAMRFPEPGLRPMDDIDVVLPQMHHQRALSALREAGWRTAERPGHHADTFLTHPQIPDFPLELHWDLETWRERSSRLRGKDLWERRVPIRCFGVPAFGLPPEMDLVALAVHAGKPFHHFHRLIWSVDFAVVIRDAPAVDWDRVAAIARATRCRTVLAIALAHAVRLGSAVPDEMLRVPAGRVRTAALQPVLDEIWPLVDCEGGIRRHLRYALSDSPFRWALLLLGELAEEDAHLVPKRAAVLLRNAIRKAWRLRR